MTGIVAEIIIILMLLAVNGALAMTEIALVSARKTRLKRLASEGDNRAKAALELVNAPNRSLSTIQIGITLIGILAGAFGGVTLADKLDVMFQTIPLLAPYGQGLGIFFVVFIITYLSLVVGELIPKRIGLGFPEGVSMAMARPMGVLSIMAKPLVTLLSYSTDTILHFFGFKPVKDVIVSEEEIKALVREGMHAGVFQKAESEMVESVLRLDRLPVRDIMTPRSKIVWLNQADPLEKCWHKIVASNHSNFPIYEGNRDRVKGIVSVKAMYANLLAGVKTEPLVLSTKPLIVPATQTSIQLLETFKQSGKHIALVTDEFGGIVGLVTLNDVLEAIVGDFPAQSVKGIPSAILRPDGSWLVDAMIEPDKIKKLLPGLKLDQDESNDYQTLAGFIVKHLGRVPKEGESFEWQNYLFEILDMDRHRLDKILVIPTRTTEKQNL